LGLLLLSKPLPDLILYKSGTYFLLVPALVFQISVVLADIYSWEDAQGRIHYSDRPNEGSEKLDITPGYAYHVVEYVYDGDTILLDDGKKIRLLGINTPEVESSRKDGEPGGLEAKRWLTQKIQGRKVRLGLDAERKDRYHRHLAHLFTPEGLHLNLEMVSRGLATVNIHPPNLKYVDPLLKAQKSAEGERLGIWGEATYAPIAIAEIPSLGRRGWSRLVGKPIDIRPGRKFDRLIFSTNFNVRIPRKNLELFPALNTYLGKALEVRGWVSRRNKKYSVLIRHPSDLVERNE